MSYNFTQSMYKMELHEVIHDSAHCLHILKVPNGWIYFSSDNIDNGVFVPEPRRILDTGVI